VIRTATHEVTAGGKRIGHVLSGSRGHAAYDSHNILLGTYSSAEAAISAVAGHNLGTNASLQDAAGQDII
jgi:hypothetical protein